MDDAIQLPPTDQAAERRATPGVRMLTVIALLLIGSLPLAPAVLGGRFPRTQEGIRYETLLSFFHQSIASGFIYPRWLPELAGGLGYPTFVFYQPVVFFIASGVMSIFGAGSVIAMQVTALLMSVLGSGGAYLLAREFVGRVTAIACSALFILTPYAWVNLYVRGDHSEYAAMMLTPWPFAFLLIASRRFVGGGRLLAAALIGAAISIAAIVATHPAVTIVAIPLALIMAAERTFGFVGGMRWRWLATLAIVAIAAAAMSSPYWWWFTRYAPYVRLDRITRNEFRPELHTIEPWRLFSNFWGFGVSGARGSTRPVGMSFQLGLPHLILAVVGLVVGWRRPWVIMAAIAYVVLAVLMTTYADAFWRLETPVRKLQFPWRLLASIAVLQLLLAAAAFSRLRAHSAIAAALASACVLTSGGWYHAMFTSSTKPFDVTDGSKQFLDWEKAQAVVDNGVMTFAEHPEALAGMNEFDPIWIHIRPAFRHNGPMLDAGACRVDYKNSSTSSRIDATLTSPSPTKVVLQQFYFPGWHVELNGSTVADATLLASALPDGRMQLSVPAGDTAIVAYYDGPIGWRIELVIAAVLSLGGITVLAWLARRPPIHPQA